MKTLSFWKKSLYSALIFFGTLIVLSVGYSAWNTAMSKVTAGNPLSATAWNALVDNIADLDSRWVRSGGNIVFTGGNVGIGTTSPGVKLDVSSDGGTIINANGTHAGEVGYRIAESGASKWYLYKPSNSSDFHIYESGYSPRLIIQGTTGNIGIGTTSLAWWEKLAVASNGARISFGDNQAGNPTITWQGGGLWLTSTGGVYIGNSLGGYGSITANVFNTASDRRLKDNITPLSWSLDKILSLSGYSFTWKESKTQDIGVIAQEVEKVFPNLVHTNKNTTIKSVEYANLVAPLIEAAKELSHKLDELFAKYIDQQKEIDSLKARLDRLEQK